MQRCRLILAGVVFASALVASESAATDLRGLYVVTKVPPSSKANGDAASAALNVPGVSGALLVMGWDVIEPAMGQFDWTDFDQWMTMAASTGKKVELSITTGYVGSNHTPSWLFQPPPGGGGASPLTFSFTRHPTDTTCLTESIAAPWDTAFLAQWDALLAALSAHLKSTGRYDSVVLLRLTGINKDSDGSISPASRPTRPFPAVPTTSPRGSRPATVRRSCSRGGTARRARSRRTFPTSRSAWPSSPRPIRFLRLQKTVRSLKDRSRNRASPC